MKMHGKFMNIHEPCIILLANFCPSSEMNGLSQALCQWFARGGMDFQSVESRGACQERQPFLEWASMSRLVIWRRAICNRIFWKIFKILIFRVFSRFVLFLGSGSLKIGILVKKQYYWAFLQHFSMEIWRKCDFQWFSEKSDDVSKHRPGG